MNSHWRSLTVAAALLLLTSCGQEKTGGQASSTNYKDTKSMVMDILKSDDGRKAVQTAAYGGDTITGTDRPTGIKTLAVGDAKQLQLAVKDVLTDTQNSAFLQNLMKDPKFAGDFAKAIQKENKQLMKDLMKDPEYQELQLDTMKNPEYQKILIDTMRGMQYRQHVMSVIQESMQSPLFKAEMINMLKKAIEEGTAAQAQTAKAGGGGGGGDSTSKGKDGGGGTDKSSDKSGDSSGGSDSSDSSDQDGQDSGKKKQKSSSDQ